MLTPHLFNAPCAITAYKSATVSKSRACCTVSAFGLQSRLLPHRLIMLVCLDPDCCDSQRNPGPSSENQTGPRVLTPSSWECLTTGISGTGILTRQVYKEVANLPAAEAVIKKLPGTERSLSAGPQGAFLRGQCP